MEFFKNKSKMRVVSLLMAVVLAFQLPLFTGPASAADSGGTLFDTSDTLVAATVPFDSGQVRAIGPTVNFGSSLTMVSVEGAATASKPYKGTDLTTLHNVPIFTPVKIKYIYEIKDSGITNETLLTFTIPCEVSLPQDTQFSIVNGDGKVVSVGGIVKPKPNLTSPNSAEFKFTKEAHDNDLTDVGAEGEFWIIANLDADVIGNSGKHTIDFSNGNGNPDMKLEIDFAIIQPSAEVAVTKETNDVIFDPATQTITWIIKVKPEVMAQANAPVGSDAILNFKFTDTLPEGLTYQSASISGSGISSGNSGFTVEKVGTRDKVSYTPAAGDTIKSGETHTIAIVSKFTMADLKGADAATGMKTFTNKDATADFDYPQLKKEADGTVVLKPSTDGDATQHATAKSGSATAKVPAGFAFKGVEYENEFDPTYAKLKWTVKLNESKYAINEAMATDKLPEWVQLDDTTLALTVGGNTKALAKDDKLTAPYTYRITNTSATTSKWPIQKLEVKLGKLTELAVLTYSTKIDPAYFLDNSASQKPLKNTVVLTGEEGGTGPGTGISITYDASKEIKPGTGLLTKAGTYRASDHSTLWTITVNGNKQILTGVGVLEDVVPDGQVLVPFDTIDGDVNNFVAATDIQIKDSGGAVTLPVAVEAPQTIKITMPGKINKEIYTVQYRTRLTANQNGIWAVNNNDGITKADPAKVSNKATMPVFEGASKLTADATVNAPSQLVEKAGTGYDFANRTLGWKVTLNQNEMKITNPTLVDDMDEATSGLKLYLPEGPSDTGFTVQKVGGVAVVPTRIFSEGARIAGAPTFIYDETTHVLKVFFGTADESIHDKYIVTYRAQITDLTQLNTNNKVTFKNKVQITGEELDNPAKAPVTFTASQEVQGGVISKAAGTISEAEETVQWNITINKSRAKLGTPEAPVEIIDDLKAADANDKQLSYKPNSAKLYQLTLDANGNATRDTEDVLAKMGVVSYNQATGKWVFRFNKVIDEAYLLTLETDVYSISGGKVTNSASISGGASSGNEGGSEAKVDWAAAGGTAYSRYRDILVHKVDSVDGKTPIAGVKFALVNAKNETIDTQETDKNGYARFENIRTNVKYTIKELSRPVGYCAPENAVVVTEFTLEKPPVTQSTPAAAIEKVVTNTAILGRIEITKTDGYQPNGIVKPLAGAEFTLEKEGDAAFGKKIATTDASGKLLFENLRVGAYTVKETKAPAGYVLSSEVHSFTVADDPAKPTQSFKHTFINVLNPGELTVTKLDESNNTPLAGAEFTLSAKGADVETITTDATGKAKFTTPLARGVQYAVREEKAPAGYARSTEVKPFTVTEPNQQVTFTFHNTRILGRVEITKKDAFTNDTITNNPATFTLEKEGDATFSKQTATTATNGIAVFENLPVGSYRITEVVAPSGYVVGTAPLKVVVKEESAGGTVVQVEELTVYNKPIRGTLEVTKTNANGKRVLAGAEIGLYKEGEATPLLTITTGADGKATFTSLAVGSYFYTELKAPKGYQINNTKYNFTIQTDGEVIAANLKNIAVSSSSSGGSGNQSPPPEQVEPPAPPAEPPVTSTVEKNVDITYPKTGEPNNSTNGKVAVPPSSTVTLGKPPANGKVIVTPDGAWEYVPHPEFKGTDTFTVYITKPNGEVEAIAVKVNVLSALVNALPQTGEGGRMGYYLGGIALMLCGLALNIALRRRARG